MKIAVGIIGIGVSLFVMVQAFLLTGLSGMAGEEAMQNASAVGLLVAFLMFVASAFTFGLPRTGGIIFLLASLLGFALSSDIPDMGVWGAIALILGILAFISGALAAKKAKKAVA